MNLDVTADDSCLDPHVSCVQTSHPATPLDVNSEQRSVRQSMMSGPHRGDSAHIHYNVWDIGEVHPGVVSRPRRPCADAERNLSNQTPFFARESDFSAVYKTVPDLGQDGAQLKNAPPLSWWYASAGKQTFPLWSCVDCALPQRVVRGVVRVGCAVAQWFSCVEELRGGGGGATVGGHATLGFAPRCAAVTGRVLGSHVPRPVDVVVAEVPGAGRPATLAWSLGENGTNTSRIHARPLAGTFRRNAAQTISLQTCHWL